MSLQNPIFIPGPTNIPDRLRRAMNVPTQDHRAPDFSDTFLPVLADCKKVFGTQDGEIILFTSSGTGGWEAAISNTLSLHAMVCSLIAGSICVSATDLMCKL